MTLLVVTRHGPLVDRLRLAFEGAGCDIVHAADPLEALALDLWTEVRAMLVDATQETMDGYRLCRLLRSEARVLFRNLPIFLIVERGPSEEEELALREVEADGFLFPSTSVPQLKDLLGGFLDRRRHPEGPGVPVLSVGLQPHQEARARELLRAGGMALRSLPPDASPEAVRRLGAPVALVGLSEGGVPGAAARVAQLRAADPHLFPILAGRVPRAADQTRLLEAGVAEWLSLPFSGPRLLHACRRAVEWGHARQVHEEYRSAFKDLQRRRTQLEREAEGLRSEALRDPLTNLLNRRAFNQNLDQAFLQWERNRRDFVLLSLDLDHFKAINDRFGHPAGDLVLRQVAARMRGALRRSDLAFRMGGEEFAILLQETSLRPGQAVAEKVRARIGGEPFHLPDGGSAAVTISVGVAGPWAPTVAALLTQVDEALYCAKREGRDRVVVAGNGPPPPLRPQP